MSALTSQQLLSIAAGGIKPGKVPARSGSSGSARELGRSPLTDIFPVTRTISGGFTTIAVPAGFTVPAGQAAWYPLINVVPYAIYGQEVALFGISVEMLSTNNPDSNPVVGAAEWGTAAGLNAAIVVGTRLPIGNAAAWRAGPSYVPGVNATLLRDSTRYLWYTTFPPGSYNDSIPFKYTLNKQYQPYVVRIPDHVRLQAALVIDGAQAQAGAGDNVIGLGSVELSLGMTQTTVGYQGT